MLVQILTIARNTFVEAIRQPIYFVLVMLSGLLQVLNTWGTAFSMDYSSTAEVSADNKLLLDIGLATVFVCATLLAAFVATSAISREIDNKTALTVVSKPIARPTIILGKYVGIAGAILMAVVMMLVFLLLAIRHEVMSTAADKLDGPVLVFSISATVLALGLAAWCNYFYGWVFPQTAMLLLMPLSLLAYFGVLLVAKDWTLQSPAVDFKPQITIACYCLTLAILVLSAIACAASTRLGQVMTITVCAGAFMIGLLSNYLLGRRALINEHIGMIASAEAAEPEQESFLHAGDTYKIEFGGVPIRQPEAGMSFYYGSNPNGYRLCVPAFPPYEGDDIGDFATYMGPEAEPRVLITQVDGATVTVRNVGRRPVPVERPPGAGDYVFLQPTKVNPVPFAVWAVLPNVQHFWLVDAVTQNRAIPSSHVLLLTGYSALQILFYLAIGVQLFQRREIG